MVRLTKDIIDAAEWLARQIEVSYVVAEFKILTILNEEERVRGDMPIYFPPPLPSRVAKDLAEAHLRDKREYENEQSLRQTYRKEAMERVDKAKAAKGISD